MGFFWGGLSDNQSDKYMKESKHFQLLSLGNWKNCDNHGRYRKVRKGRRFEGNTGEHIYKLYVKDYSNRDVF